jgi:hypothetical protein
MSTERVRRGVMMPAAVAAALWLSGPVPAAFAAEPAVAPAKPKGDPRAAELMRRSEETRYSWPADVARIEGRVEWTVDNASGKAGFSADLRTGTVEVSHPDEAAARRIQGHLRSLITHRAAPPAPAGDRAAKEPTAYAIVVEDEERGPLIMPVGDPMLSTYRVNKDGLLVQVNRTTPGSRFTIDIKDAARLADGRYWTTAYTLTRWDPATGKRTGRTVYAAEGFHDVGGRFFPKAEKVESEGDGRTTRMELRFSDIRFTAEPAK